MVIGKLLLQNLVLRFCYQIDFLITENEIIIKIDPMLLNLDINKRNIDILTIW